MIAAAATQTFTALGTSATVAVTEASALENATAVVEREIRAIDETCSRFRPDSELVALNERAGQPVIVSPVLFDAVAVALRAARLTGGRVSPTVGSAVRVLGYDRDFTEVPRTGDALRIRASVVAGWRAVRLDRRASTVCCPVGVELDLGATAKAWCADRAAEAAAGATGAGVLVSLGGDIAVAGRSPEGGWSVRVTDDQAAPLDAPGQTVAIAEGGLATSGTVVRRWMRGGRELHHVIDPATGWSASSPWRTASVRAGSCVDANTASTAAIVLGPAAPQWLTERHLAARLVDVKGNVTVFCGWPADDGGPS